MRTSPARPRRAIPFTAAAALLLVPLLATCTLPGFVDEAVFAGLDNPMAVRFSPDGRVFVAEKRGVVKVFDGLADTSPSVALDIRTNVYNESDRGLMSIALDPDFPTKPDLYVLYALDAAPGGTPPRWGAPGEDADPCPTPPGADIDGCVNSARLSRFSLANGTAGPEQVLVTGWCHQFSSHSVGDLKFGPDGALYASAGDGAAFTFADYGQAGVPPNPCGDPPAGVAGQETLPTAEGGALRAQDHLTPGDPQTLDSTIIRVDPATGLGAAGNPDSGSTDANRRRIVAAGVRNPFRFTFRPGTGELWFGDVGWSNWEELDRLADPVSSGIKDYGWPCLEGGEPTGYDIGINLCQGLYDGSVPAVQPYFRYNHWDPMVDGDSCTVTNGSSISGLAFYPGGSYPPQYAGALFYADYSRQCIWVMQKGSDGLPDPSTRRFFVGLGVYPVDLQIGPNNDLFYVDLGKGEVHRVRYESGPQPPTAAIAANPTTGPLPLTVNLSAAGSSNPGGGALNYDWDLDHDGAYDDASGVTVSKTFTTAGQYQVGVKVTNVSGASSTASTTILAGTTPPVPTIAAPSSSVRWAVGDAINFSGSATDAEDGALPVGSLRWDVIMHHCATIDACHIHPVTSIVGQSSGTIFAPDHEYPSYLELKLTATDSSGVTGTTSVRLDPKPATVNVTTLPAGVPVTLSSKSGLSPFTATVIQGSHLTLSVPATYQAGQTSFTFSSWSDGLARTHDLIAPAGTTNLSAAFVRNPSADPAYVAAYGFDEASGGTTADLTGKGHTGTLSGGPSRVTGHSGNGLSFDGINDIVNIADANDLDATGAVTIEAWIKPDGSDGWQSAVLKETDTGLTYALYARGDDTDSPLGGVNIDGVDQAVQSPFTPAANAWTHIAFTYDGANLVLYVNGTEVNRRPMTGAVTPSTGALRLGGNSFWGEHFAGVLDDARVYTRALTPAEILIDRDDSVP